MQILSLKLTGFRNLEKQELVFSPGVNLLTGENGQGKTNLLEAIHCACTGKSQRRAKDREMIALSGESAYLEAEGTASGTSALFSVGFNRKGEKRIQFNNKIVRKTSEFLGRLSLVSFSPEDVAMVRGEPAARRYFIDLLLSQVHPVYLDQLQAYRSFLVQRNFLLRRNSRPDPLLLRTFTEKLMEHGAFLMEQRLRALIFLSEKAAELLTRMTGKFGVPGMRYHPSFAFADRVTLLADMEKAFEEQAETEKAMGATRVGPHRDDMDLEMNGHDLRRFGSQGQCRAMAVAVKLAAVEYIRFHTSENPVLLFDDVFAELDDELSGHLHGILSGCSQVFLAAPRMEWMPGSCADFPKPLRFSVSAGKAAAQEA